MLFFIVFRYRGGANNSNNENRDEKSNRNNNNTVSLPNHFPVVRLYTIRN